jgi:uncharacterized membrane protein YfcA
MKRIVKFLVLPGLVPILFFTVAATPVDLLGCRNRGLLAVVIALAVMLASLGAAIMGAKGRMRRDPQAHWWVVSALVLAMPAVAVLFIPD